MRSKIQLTIAAIILLVVGIGLRTSAQDDERQQPGTRPVDAACKSDFDCPDGIVKVGDRVIFVTDYNNDGFFEKNVAFVADDVNATAAINGTPLQVGNLVNLWVFPSASTGFTAPYRVYSVKRGRRVGEYEALVNAN